MSLFINVMPDRPDHNLTQKGCKLQQLKSHSYMAREVRQCKQIRNRSNMREINWTNESLNINQYKVLG